MKNKINFAFCLLLMCLLIIGVNFNSFSQELENELSVKLSKNEKQQLVKANEFKNKGKLLEQAALTEQETTISKTDLDKKKSEKKYAQKRMDASDLYSKAIDLKQDLLKSSIKTFWKNFKGDKQAFVLVKSLELTSIDSLKKGFDLRNKAVKITKSSERLEKLLSAETILNKYCIILEKVDYIYLNWPVEYDQNWIVNDDNNVSQKNIVALKIDSKSTKDSIFGDTINKIIVDKENIKSDSTPIKSFVVGNEKIDSTKSFTGSNPEKTYGVSEIVNSSQINHVKNDSTFLPGKDSTIFQPNDSSLYGKAKINEEEVDKFNGFLKKKYPDKYEDYVINFQNMDYSDIEGLKNSWHKYLYGSNDTAKYIGGIKKLKTDTIGGVIASIDSINSGGKINNVITEDKLVQTEFDHGKATIANNLTTETKKDSKVKDNSQTIGTNGKSTTKSSKVNKTNANSSVVTLSKQNNTKPRDNNQIREAGFQHVSDDMSNDFLFHVQIVACRTPLKLISVKSICNTNDSIIEFYEDNWYKYAIGTFTTYREASHKRNELKVPGVFVIAYLHGKRIKISPAIAYKRKGTATLKKQN